MVSAYEAEQRRGFYPAVWREPVALFYSTSLCRVICTAGGWVSVPLPLPSGSAVEPSKGYGI